MVKLFIGNLPDGNLVSNDDIRPLFETHGAVSECEVIKNYGFVHMDNEQEATEAIKALNGRDVKGRRMKVEMSTGVGRDDRRSQTTQKLFVGNVADGTTDQQLRDLFEAHITVVEADVIDNKNFGFVHVDLGVSGNSRDGRNKLDEILNQLSGAELNGNRLRIQKSEGGGGGDRGGRGGGGVRGGRGGGFDGGRGGGYSNRGHRGGFDRGYDRGYDRNYGGGPPRGRGGRGGRRDAPYPPRGGGGYNSGYNNNSGGYRDDFGPKDFGNYGQGGPGGGPMRGSSYGGDRDGGHYNSYGQDGGHQQDQMYSRRPAQAAPQQPQGYGTASYGGGQGGGGYAVQGGGGYAVQGDASFSDSSYFSSPPPQQHQPAYPPQQHQPAYPPQQHQPAYPPQQHQPAYPPSYPPAAPAHGYGGYPSSSGW